MAASSLEGAFLTIWMWVRNRSGWNGDKKIKPNPSSQLRMMVIELSQRLLEFRIAKQGRNVHRVSIILEDVVGGHASKAAFFGHFCVSLSLIFFFLTRGQKVNRMALP